MGTTLTSERDRAVLRSFAHRIDANDAGAHNNLGVLYFNKGMPGEAVAAFLRALDLDPRMTVAERNLEIACFTGGYLDRRLEELTARLAEGDGDREARWELGRTWLVLGDARRAIAEFTVLLRDAPSDVGVIRQLARAEARSGDLEAATRWLHHARALDPADPGLLLQLGEVAYHRGRNEEARAALAGCLEQNPGDADALYLLGFVLGDLGRQEEASAATRQAFRLNPALGRAHANLSLEQLDGASYRAARAAREARGVADAMQVVPGGQLAHFNLGLAFRQKGYLEGALREYRAALERGEDPTLVRQAMAEVQLLRKDSRAAVQSYDALLQGQPQSPKLWNERGVALHQDGRYLEALDSYRAALEADPAYVLAHNNLGVAAFHAGDVAAAGRAFERSLELEAGFIKGRLNLALLLVRQDRHQPGLEAFRQVLRLAPEHPVAWNGVGLVLSGLKRHHDARNAFSRAIERRPDYAEAHYNLGFALSNLGDYPGALRATRRALELDPYYTPQKFELAIDLEFEDPFVEVPAEFAGDERPGAVEAFVFEPGAVDALFEEFLPATVDAGATGRGDAPRSEARSRLARGDGDAPVDAEAIGRGDAALSEARACLARGDGDAALAAVRRAVGEGAPRSLCLVLQGDVFITRGAAGEALERFREARALDPRFTAAVVGEARALILLRRLADAAPAAEWLRTHAASDVDALLVVARVDRETDQVAGARDALDRAGRLAPGRVDVLVECGRFARAEGDLAAAAIAFRAAVSSGDLNPESAVELADALVATGAVAEAEDVLAGAHGRHGGDAALVLLLARLRRERRAPVETIGLLADFLSANPYHVDALASLAESLMLLGRASDAAFAIARILRFDPDHVGALYLDGVLLAEAHRYGSAIDCWARVVDLEPAGDFARRARRDARIAVDLQHVFRRPDAGHRSA